MPYRSSPTGNPILTSVPWLGYELGYLPESATRRNPARAVAMDVLPPELKFERSEHRGKTNTAYVE